MDIITNVSVAAHTLGCKVNQCDTDAVLAQLTRIGCNIVHGFNMFADVYIINTCTVTHTADKKSAQMIRRARKTNPNAIVAVCGCMTKNNATTTNALGADYIFDARSPSDFINFIGATFPAHPPTPHPGGITTRTRSFVKVQDGCDRFCTYCIVPYVRGKPVSRSVADIVAEVSTLLEMGVQEIVLTGIQVACYGQDTDNITFAGLIKQVLNLNNLKRLRLSSLDPCAITDDFLHVVASNPRLCDHFHLSLQSGCNTTLAAMNRRYTAEQYAKVAKSLLEIRPNAAITTDIIVGFPGETDEHFEQSFEFAKKIGFADIHVFEYSKRAGTPAATFDGQIADMVKSERGKRMRALAASLQTRFYSMQVGKTANVLFETPKDADTARGHTSNYCPIEVVNINGNKCLANTIQSIEITGYTNGGLVGKAADAACAP